MHLVTRPFLLAFLFATTALAVALVSQYAFDTHPCHLCLVQRYPYGVAMVLAAGGMAVVNRQSLRHAFLYGCIACFLATGGTALYHSAVEQGWVAGPDSCTMDAAATVSIDDLRRRIMQAPLVSCSEIGASFLGLSMATWNALYAFAAAAVLFRSRNRLT